MSTAGSFIVDKYKLSNPLLWVGVFFNLASNVWYYFLGFSFAMFVLWSLGLIFIGIFLYRLQKNKPKDYSPKDIKFIATLLVVFAPLYLALIYLIPYQINTDEVTIMFFAKRLSSGILDFDLFGLSEYFGFPSLIFIVWGWVSKFLGGIDLAHFRTTHALSGLVVVILTYLFFRLYISSFQSFVVAALVAGNHALIGISRMAMRDNSGLLLEVLSLLFLFKGFKNQSLFYVFLGGLISGLTFYTYFSARFTIFIWLAFLFLVSLLFKKEYSFKRIAVIALISVFGFILTALPVSLASYKAPQFLDYPKQQILLFFEGRKLQQEWLGTQTAAEGVKINILQGLTTFNNNLSDHGNIYPNFGHGFVDPLSGVLLWIGLAVILVKFFIKKETEYLDIFAVVGFVSLWLVYAFLVNKAPNYTRLLVILPFSAYLIFRGIKFVSQVILKIIKPWSVDESLVTKLSMSCLLGIVVGWNFIIFTDFVNVGLKQGNDVGSTARFVEERKDRAGYSFYLAASAQNPYYTWGEEWQWRDWVGFFASEDQRVQVIPPGDYSNLPTKSFVVFMSRAVWFGSQDKILAQYPNLKVYNMKIDGSLIAIEVP